MGRRKYWFIAMRSQISLERLSSRQGPMGTTAWQNNKFTSRVAFGRKKKREKKERTFVQIGSLLSQKPSDQTEKCCLIRGATPVPGWRGKRERDLHIDYVNESSNGYPSISCWDISFKTTNINLMMELVKHLGGGPQNECVSSSGDHEYL